MLCICFCYYFEKIDWISVEYARSFQRNICICIHTACAWMGLEKFLVTTHSHLQTFVSHCIHWKSGRKPITLFYILEYINNLMYVHKNVYIHICINKCKISFEFNESFYEERSMVFSWGKEKHSPKFTLFRITEICTHPQIMCIVLFWKQNNTIILMFVNCPQI